MRPAAREQRGRHHPGDDAEPGPVVGHVAQLVRQLVTPPVVIMRTLNESAGHLTDLAGEGEADLA